MECRFFQSTQVAHGGECRIEAPVMNEGQRPWPIVDDNDWCGEWKEK